MRFGELIFILIFIFIGLINVIARVIASKTRKKKEAAGVQEKPSPKGATETLALSAIQEKEERARRGYVEEKEQLKGLVEKVAKSQGITGTKEIEASREKERYEAPTPETLLAKESNRPEYSSDISTISEVKRSRLESSTLPTMKPGIKSRLTSDVGFGVKREIPQKDRSQMSAWKKVNKLSYLKKAVVLSEILGKPKGML